MCNDNEGHGTVTLHSVLFRKIRAAKSSDYHDVISKNSVFKMFSAQTNTQNQRFQIPPV